MQLFKRLAQKMRKINTTVEDYQEKIAFSEANVHDGQDVETVDDFQKNLLVASHENRFSEDMMEYSLDMATRMDCGIVAVNAANLTHEVMDFFSTTYDALCEDFRSSSQQNIKQFHDMAKEKGIEFTHAVKFSGIDRAIEDITKEHGHIEFIISENQETQRPQNTVENETRIAQRLCVYSLN